MMSLLLRGDPVEKIETNREREREREREIEREREREREREKCARERDIWIDRENGEREVGERGGEIGRTGRGRGGREREI